MRGEGEFPVMGMSVSPYDEVSVDGGLAMAVPTPTPIPPT